MQTGETFKKLTLSASIQHAFEHGYIKWTGSSQECKTLKIRHTSHLWKRSTKTATIYVLNKKNLRFF